jgi:uncharacterized membrane protein
LPITRLAALVVTRTLRSMDDHWLPYSAAALASGAVALVLGTLGLPTSPDDLALLQSAQVEGGRWVMAAAAFFFCAVGLGLGLPTFLFAAPRKGRLLGYAGTAALGVATLAMAAYGALLVFFQALAVNGIVDDAEMVLLGEDAGLRAFTVVFLGSFYLAEALLAAAMYRSRSAPRWVPTLFVLHVAMLPLTGRVPQLVGVGAVLVGVAFMGVAVSANERFQLARVGREH